MDKSEHHDLPWSRDCELKISWRLIRLVGNEPSTRELNGMQTVWSRDVQLTQTEHYTYLNDSNKQLSHHRCPHTVCTGLRMARRQMRQVWL